MTRRSNLHYHSNLYNILTVITSPIRMRDTESNKKLRITSSQKNISQVDKKEIQPNASNLIEKKEKKRFNFELNLDAFNYNQTFKTEDTLKKINQLKKKLLLTLNLSLIQTNYLENSYNILEKTLLNQNHTLNADINKYYTLVNQEKWDIDFDEHFEYVYPSLITSFVNSLDLQIRFNHNLIEFIHEDISVLHSLKNYNVLKRRQSILNIEKYNKQIKQKQLERISLKNIDLCLQKNRSILRRFYHIKETIHYNIMHRQMILYKTNLATRKNQKNYLSNNGLKAFQDLFFSSSNSVLNEKVSHTYFKGFLSYLNKILSSYEILNNEFLNLNTIQGKKNLQITQGYLHPFFLPMKHSLVRKSEIYLFQFSQIFDSRKVLFNNVLKQPFFAYINYVYNWNLLSFFQIRLLFEKIYYERLYLLDEASQLLFTQAKKRSMNVPEFFELVRDGVPWILHALYKFDTERQTSFLTYSKYWIRHGIQTSISQKRHLIKMPNFFYKKNENNDSKFVNDLKKDVFNNLYYLNDSTIQNKLKTLYQKMQSSDKSKKFVQFQSIESTINHFDEESEAFIDLVKDNQMNERSDDLLFEEKNKVILNLTFMLPKTLKTFIFLNEGFLVYQKHRTMELNQLFGIVINNLDSELPAIINSFEKMSLHTFKH